MATLDGGNLYRYFGDVKDYIEIGPEASIIVESANYDDY